MKKTKIICTIGPASDSVETMEEMVNKGMDCARINLSHATEENRLKIVSAVQKVRIACDVPVAIMYDTKGPEFRSLTFEDGGITLQKDDTIKMSKNCSIGNKDEFGVNHSNAIDFIEIGDKVLVDNALLELEVIDKKDDFVVLKALDDGKIQDHKSINVPGVNLKLNFMSDVDKKDITFAAQHSCDYLALSFVNKKEDVIEARKIIEEAGGDCLIISKIESHKGGKFAIVATEMLASMYESPRPTRAEVSDVANAILDGTDCVMLSGETTIGKYPIDAVETMSKICKYVESTIDYSKHVAYKGNVGISDTISKLVRDAVEYADIKLIVTPTMSGFTARKISNLRPNSIILACCPSYRIADKVILNFGVKPVITEVYESTDKMVENARKMAKKEFNLKDGDLIVVTGGFPLGESKRTNYLRIIEI